jgi:hypothetical protein
VNGRLGAIVGAAGLVIGLGLGATLHLAPTVTMPATSTTTTTTDLTVIGGGASGGGGKHTMPKVPRMPHPRGNLLSKLTGQGNGGNNNGNGQGGIVSDLTGGAQ